MRNLHANQFVSVVEAKWSFLIKGMILNSFDPEKATSHGLIHQLAQIVGGHGFRLPFLFNSID